MFDRADQLCELAKQVIEAAAAALPIEGTAVEVVCEDDADVDTGELPTGQMKVFVSWERYEDGGPASRGEQMTDYLLVITAVEVCAEPGKVSRAWRKVRTNWFGRCVVDALGEARQKLDGAYSLRQDVVAFDLEELTERKAFWCGAGVTLRDIRRVKC